MRNVNDVAHQLSVTPRRVRQLCEAGVLLLLDNGEIDAATAAERFGVFSRRNAAEIAALIDECERAALDAAKSAKRLEARPTLSNAKAAAAAARAFDETGALIEAMRPEHERALLRHARSTFVAQIAARALEVAQRYGVAR